MGIGDRSSKLRAGLKKTALDAKISAGAKTTAKKNQQHLSGGGGGPADSEGAGGCALLAPAASITTNSLVIGTVMHSVLSARIYPAARATQSCRQAANTCFARRAWCPT